MLKQAAVSKFSIPLDGSDWVGVGSVLGGFRGGLQGLGGVAGLGCQGWRHPLRDALRPNAERLAAENGLKIEFIRRTRSFRKEDNVHEAL